MLESWTAEPTDELAGLSRQVVPETAISSATWRSGHLRKASWETIIHGIEKVYRGSAVYVPKRFYERGSDLRQDRAFRLPL